jgi:hypothetical protein
MRLFSLLLFFLCTQVWGVKQNFILNGEYYASPADSLYGNLKRIGIYDFIPDASKQTTVFLHFSPYKYRNTHTGINSGSVTFRL